MSRARAIPGTRRLAAAVATLASLVTLSESAHASPLFELVGGVGDRAGFNGRAAGASAASAYFNPALLPKAAEGFATGVLVLSDAIELSVDGRGDVDVPVEYRGATQGNGSPFLQPSLPTAWLREGCTAPQCDLPLLARPRQSAGSSGHTRTYQLIGFATQAIGPQLVLGLYGLVPLRQFTAGHSFFVDEREQFFTNSLHAELYADRLTATSLALGLGSQVFERLSIGMSFTLGLHNTASSVSFVGNADDLGNTLVVSNEVGVETEFSPHLGISYDPLDRLHLSLTAHSIQQFDIVTSISTLLPNGNKQTATRTQVHDYLPWRFGFGASVDLIAPEPDEPANGHALSLVASGILGLWSTYRDRQGERPLDAYAWSNTVTVALGLRHSYGQVRSFLDAQFVPTPVPLQTGRTNYVDNDRVSASGGVEYEFTLFSSQWRLGLQAQIHTLLRRYQRKIDPLTAADATQLVRDEFPDDAIDARGEPIPSAAGLQTNNPGWPGFASHGVLGGGGITLALLF